MTSDELSVWATFAATAVTAIATGVLAWFTWSMARATKAMAQSARDSFITASLEPSRWSFTNTDLVIENSSNNPAYDILIEIDPPIHRTTRGQEREIVFNRISVMRPGYTLRNWIGKGDLFLTNTHTVTLKWKSHPSGGTYNTVKYELDLRHFKDMHLIGAGDPLVSLAQEIKKIRDSVEHISRGTRTLEVNIYDQKDRDQKDLELEEFFDRHNRRIDSEDDG